MRDHSTRDSRSELETCRFRRLATDFRFTERIAHFQEATWHPLEAGTGRNTSTLYAGLPQDCGVSPPFSRDGEADNNNSGAEDLTYLRHLELEPIDPLTGLPLHPGFTARGGRTPCTITRRLIRQAAANQVSRSFLSAIPLTFRFRCDRPRSPSR